MESQDRPKEMPGAKPFEGGSLEASEKLAETRGKESISAVKAELGGRVKEEAGGFRKTLSSWWEKTKGVFSRGKDKPAADQAIAGLEAKASGLEGEYQKKVDAALTEGDGSVDIDVSDLEAPATAKKQALIVEEESNEPLGAAIDRHLDEAEKSASATQEAPAQDESPLNAILTKSFKAPEAQAAPEVPATPDATAAAKPSGPARDVPTLNSILTKSFKAPEGPPPPDMPVGEMSRGQMQAEYERLAKEVAEQGEAESKMMKKALKKADADYTVPTTPAAFRMNEIAKLLNEKPPRKTAQPSRPEAATVAAEAKPAAAPAEAAPTAEAPQDAEVEVTDDMIVESSPAEAPADMERKKVEALMAQVKAAFERINAAEATYVRKLTAKGDTENLQFAVASYENRAKHYESMNDEQIVANAVEIGAIKKEDAELLLKSGRAADVRKESVAGDRKLAAEARGEKAEPAAAEQSAEAPAKKKEETADEALARMEAGHEKLSLREAELEGMVEIADDIASGKLKKTDLSAAQMLWLEKPGELENARDELATVREARQLAKKQIDDRKPKPAEAKAATAETPAAPPAAEAPKPPKAEEVGAPLRASVGDMLAAKAKPEKKKPRRKSDGGQVSANA